MSKRRDLLEVLESDGLTPDSVRHLAEISRKAFQDSSSTNWLIAWSVFRGLADYWDDGQGVSTGEFDRVQSAILAPTRKWISTDEAFQDAVNLEEAVSGFHRAFF